MSFLGYLMSKNVVTLKSGSEVTQGHRKWYYLIDCVWFLVFYSNFFRKIHRFWDIRLVAKQWPWNLGYGSLKVIGTDVDRFATYDFLLTFHSNHGPISYRFRDIQRFQLKIASCILCPRWRGSPWELGTSAGGQKTRMMGLTGRQKSFTIYSAVWIECTNVTDGQTDGRTRSHNEDRAYA